MGEYASKGVAGTGLGLGIAGTALGLLNNNGSNILGGILGNNNVNNQVMELMSENSLLKAENYSDKVGKEVYENLSTRFLDKYISPMAQEIADARVREATMSAEIKCIKETSCLKEQLFNARLNEVALVANNGLTNLQGQVTCLANTVAGITKTVVPIGSVCPAPMPQYNSWTAPTTTTTP